jgi:AmiR/NasT family two-component response regulator
VPRRVDARGARRAERLLEATGYLMARDHLGRPAAFERLRRAARAQRRGLGDVAADLLDAGRLPGVDA